MKQKASQPCNSYMFQLRLVLPECKYKHDLDELLKDQFIFGIAVTDPGFDQGGPSSGPPEKLPKMVIWASEYNLGPQNGGGGPGPPGPPGSTTA